MPVRTTAPDDVPGVSPYLRSLLSNRRQHVDAVRERLFRSYGYPEPGERADPLSDLIATILSQHTSDANSHRAFARLRERFPSWEQVVAAPVEEVEKAIRPGGLAVQKAPRIQQVLRAVHERFGAYDLSVLHEMSRDEARALLMSLGAGIGPKTASCVLLFAVGLPAFCVDTHIQRVCARLGLIGPRDSAEKAQHLLEAALQVLHAEEDTYAMHVAMIRHGRQICRAQRPRCMQCPLRDLCLYGSTYGNTVV
jgi:endonuclease-3